MNDFFLIASDIMAIGDIAVTDALDMRQLGRDIIARNGLKVASDLNKLEQDEPLTALAINQLRADLNAIVGGNWFTG